MHSNEAADLALQYGTLVLCLPPYSPDFATVEGVFSILKQWPGAETSEDRLGGIVILNGKRMSQHVGLMVELLFGSLTMAQCASQIMRVYCEWLRQDTACVGDDGGGGEEGAENFDEEHREGEGYDDGGADEDLMDG